MSLIEEALELSALDFQVFNLMPNGIPWRNCDDCQREDSPCRDAAGKEECDCLLCHGFYSATKGYTRLTEMWQLHPEGLIGTRTGQHSGFVVLDFDRHGGADGLAVLKQLRADGLLPTTVSAWTGGGGAHLYYRLPPGLRLRNISPWEAVDLKAEGAYVVTPPSAKTGAPGYRWAPQRAPWEQTMSDLPQGLLELLKPMSEELQIDLSSFDFDLMRTRPWDRDGKTYDEALRDLQQARPGHRNTLIFRAGCVAGEAFARRIVAERSEFDRILDQLTDAGMDTGLKHSEARSAARKGLIRGLNDHLGDSE